MIEKKIKHIYYVDESDNTKGSLCAFTENHDLRSKECIDVIDNKLKEVFQHEVYISEHTREVAEAISHCEYACIEEYTFGVEEIELFS